MKNKILNFIIDIILITIVFGITDVMMIKVFHSEKIWLELCIYIVLYGMFFGSKYMITKYFANKKKGEENE